MTQKAVFLTLFLAIFIFSACNQALKTDCCNTGAVTFTRDSLKVFVPNIFTPNKDGFNDLFTYMSNQPDAFSSHKLKIYKGIMVAFDKQDVKTLVWDGLIAGKEAKENILDYTLLLKRKNVSTADSIIEIKGKICLRKKGEICREESENCRFPDQLSETGFLPNTQESLLQNCK